MGLEGRLRKLESGRPAGRDPEDAPDPTFYRWMLESVARALLFSGEPEFTADAEGNLYSIADGRLVAGPWHRAHIRDVMGEPLAERLAVASRSTWRRFLASSPDDVEELLERLFARRRAVDSPPDFRVCVGIYVPEGAGAPDPEDEEALRRLTWALATDAEAVRLLSELTRRRDVFVAEEGGREQDGP